MAKNKNNNLIIELGDEYFDLTERAMENIENGAELYPEDITLLEFITGIQAAIFKEVIGEELCSTKMSEMDEEKWKCYDDILCNTDGVDIFAHISK